MRELVERVVEEEDGRSLHVTVGTMIELPRACFVADRIAAEADFFSFGTNDLTQMTFGFSRDDINTFLPVYLDQKVLPDDPFQSLDVDGVGYPMIGCGSSADCAAASRAIGTRYGEQLT